jgi:hypothetical protein
VARPVRAQSVNAIEDIEQASQIVLGVRQQVTVGRVDLRHARPHDPSEIEELDAARDRRRGERVPAVVNAAMLDPGGAKRGGPCPVAELLDVDLPASCCGERSGVSSRGGRLLRACMTRARSGTRRRCRELSSAPSTPGACKRARHGRCRPRGRGRGAGEGLQEHSDGQGHKPAWRKRRSPHDLSTERLGKLPASVYRCKGVVHTTEEPGRRVILQVVGKRVDIAVGQEWNYREPQTRIVVIGADDGMDEAALHEVFDECCAWA